MKALVTGATGIVGAGLVRALLEHSYEVRVLTRRTSDMRGLRGLPVECCTGDVLNPSSLSVVMRGCSLVFHAAASFSYWGQSPQEQTRLAVRGTRNVLEAAKAAQVERAVVTSSSIVLGSSQGPRVLDEDSTAGNAEPSAYARSKILQERTAFELGAKLGLDVIAVCPTLTIGAFDYRLSASNAHISNYLNDPFRSTFVGGCNLVAASDVGMGHVLAAQRGLAGRRYVVGSENLTWRQAHELMSQLAGTFGPLLELNRTTSYLAATAMEASALLSGARPLATRDEAKMSGRFYWYDHRLMSELGYAPMPAKLAIAQALAWLLARSRINDSIVRELTLAPEVLAARAQLSGGIHEAKTDGRRNATARSRTRGVMRTNL